MTKNSIFLFLCIYNLEVLIKILTRSPIILLFLNFARQPLIELGNARVEVGSDVLQSTQTQIDTDTSVRSVTSEKIRLKSVL